jgi:hypothetical protein
MGDEMPHELIAAELGVTRQRVEQIENVALEKFRIGLELEEMLGGRAEPVFTRLRGRHLGEFRRALQEVQEGRT